jgi:hypothetical protein
VLLGGDRALSSGDELWKEVKETVALGKDRVRKPNICILTPTLPMYGLFSPARGPQQARPSVCFPLPSRGGPRCPSSTSAHPWILQLPNPILFYFIHRERFIPDLDLLRKVQ